MVRGALNKWRSRIFSGAIALFVLMGALAVSVVTAGEKPMQQGFTSPQLAVTALIKALQDNNEAELLTILGPESGDFIFSGDKVADQNGRARFVEAYESKYSIESEAEGRVIFYVGKNDYPFPIPIVLQGEAWYFDTDAGLEEILNRRIGRNELHTIEVMQVYTAAQREYSCMGQNGGATVFAQKFASSENSKDGLFWEVEEGEAESPFGPLIARAAAEGYEGGLNSDPPEPFHGYYFKILTKQGEHAAGGAYDYVVDGKMVLGFALVAYPARYGVSGIMTFIINQEGIIYEKDLGGETATLASTMVTFDPDPTWSEYKEYNGEFVPYSINGKAYEGYYSSPFPDAPLILLIHDWDGLTDYEVQRADMLAKLGYAVFAVDLFGAGVRPTEVSDKRQHTGELYKDREKMRSLMYRALETAKSMGANAGNSVAVGYCFGGAAVLELARSGADLKGFVTFHGGLSTPQGQDYTQAKGKFLIMHGTADANITMADFAGLAVALEKNGVEHEMITYGGAPHGFTVFGTDRYHEEADTKSWRRFLQFLDDTLH